MSLPGLSVYINNMDVAINSASLNIHQAADLIQSAGQYLYDEGHQFSGVRLISAHDKLEFAAGDLGYGTLRYPRFDEMLQGAFNLIDTNWPNGGGVTMDDILNEMLSATPNQFTKFIGIVDAYRTALWNAPFNVDFYASLARGFTQWL